MGILRSDRVSGLGGANAINGSVRFETGRNKPIFLKIPSDDFAVGTGDFTLECWYYKSGLGTHDDAVGNIIMETGNQNGQNGIWLADAQGKLEGRVHYGSGSWNLDITSSSSMSNDTWYHVAMSRSGSTVRIFIDGALEASGSSSSDLTTAYSNEAYVGGQGNSPGNRGIVGYVSNARISNTALYTAAFTVPSARLEKLSSTLLLCCQSPGNVLQEATGKTIVTYVDNTNNKGPSASRFVPDVGEDHGTTFADNTKFDTLSYMVPPGGTTAQSNRGRGVIASIYGPAYTTNMEYLNLQSLGNTITFGASTSSRTEIGACSSSTRGVFGGGTTPGGGTGGTKLNIIDYVTIATTSNATDFGDLTAERRTLAACSNGTRGCFGGGIDDPARLNTIDYITIASAGNAADFGDLTEQRRNITSHSSTTRGIFANGLNPGPAYVNTIDYITIATTGNATDFGDTTALVYGSDSCASSVRGVIMGGTNPSGDTNVIDYITIASTGNAADFGDLTAARNQGAAMSNSIRGVFAAGEGPAFLNTIDYVTIATIGNASDFGDTNDSGRGQKGCTDSHGGIS